MKVLVTGGAGYIGSITASALEMAGHTPVILDSLVSGPRAFVCGRAFYEGDIADADLVRRIFAEHPDLALTVHMAARIVVPESVANPLLYYRENLVKSVAFFDSLVQCGRPDVLFSSSASLYALPETGFEVREGSRLEPLSPYARTKMAVEMALASLSKTTCLRAVVLRYFNPVGADPEMRSGVYASRPSHVLGQLVMVAQGHLDEFVLTGTDYPTKDGTGIRDYVHVWDLAQAHVAAVEKFDSVLSSRNVRSLVLNVGTGRGVTVRELVTTVERVTGRSIPMRVAPPRAGDAVGAYANVDLARGLLSWTSERSLEDAVESALRWGKVRHRVLGYD